MERKQNMDKQCNASADTCKVNIRNMMENMKELLLIQKLKNQSKLKFALTSSLIKIFLKQWD